MTQIRQKPTDYKSGALPTELSRHSAVSGRKPPLSPMSDPGGGQAGSEQSGTVGHTAEPIGHNPGHTRSRGVPREVPVFHNRCGRRTTFEQCACGFCLGSINPGLSMMPGFIGFQRLGAGKPAQTRTMR